MANKTLEDFFGNKVTSNLKKITFNAIQILNLASEESISGNVEDFAPEQIVSALIAYWFDTNYLDAVTNNRLSQDKTVPLVSNSASVRRSLVTRGGETQVRHDFSFSVYTKDSSDFNPNDLVAGESQSIEEPPEEGQGEL